MTYMRIGQMIGLTFLLVSTGLLALIPKLAIGQTTPPNLTTQSNELAEAEQLKQQVIQLYKQANYSEAIPLVERLLAIHRKLLGEEHIDIATECNFLALLYHRLGRYRDAEDYYKQALEMRKHLLGEEHPDVANSLNNLGMLYADQERYTEAEPLLQQALKMTKHLLGEEHPDVASSLNNLALLYTYQGRDSEAEPLFQQAINIERNLNDDHTSLAISLNALGFLYFNQGLYSKAEPLFQESLELRERLLGENHPDVAKLYDNLGVLYLKQKNYRLAANYISHALELEKRLLGDHPDVAISLDNMAYLYDILGRYKEAEDLFLQSLEMRKRLFGEQHPATKESFTALADFYWMQGKSAEALNFQTQALEIEEHYLTLNLVAGFEQQKRDYLETLFRSTNDAISVHLNSTPNNPEATRLALTTVLRRKGRILDFLTNSQQILRQHLAPENQILLDELSDTRRQIANLAFKQPTTLSLEQYRRKLASLEDEAKQLEDKLSRHSENFRTQTQPITVEAIQKLIPTDTALVEIVKYYPWYPQINLISKITFNGNPLRIPEMHYGEPRYAAYILSSQGEPQGVDLGEAKVVDEAVELLRQYLESDPKLSPDISQVKQSARELDKIIMQPIRKLLGNTHKVLLSPDSALNLVPFEALVDENNHYLVENYSFTYLTSGRDLIRLQILFPSKQPSVLIADPYFERPGDSVISQSSTNGSNSNNTRSINLAQQNFPSLPNTAEEIRAIAPLLGVSNLLIGSQASEANLKQVNSPKILHIATHGFFESVPETNLEQPEQTEQTEQKLLSDNPLLLSGLVLAGFKKSQGGGKEDGILTALEASTLNLTGTKLVVLSACNTGLGNLTTGEGIYGLRRALVIAGAESQLISLWKVDDNATKDLMVAYYKRLLTNEGRSEALRQTQLEMLLKSEKYQHPYYWAAFIPSGDWKPIQ